MRIKANDDWVSENMLLSEDDKRACIGITTELVWIAIEVSRNGLFPLDDKISQSNDEFLKKAFELAVSCNEPYELRKTLQKDFMEKGSKGKDLLSHILITECFTELCKGTKPMQIAVYLASFFGENYFKIPDELTPDK
jgi:hypothetical protein